jgi:uncharacterized membrane protein YgcG
MERAAEVVCEILHAPHTRGAALRALGELRTSHPEAAFHLEPFDQLSGAPPTSASAAPPAAGGASSSTATHAPAPPEDNHLLGGDGGGRGWQRVASGALLGRSEDPMLRACAEVAAADADTARMLFEPALHSAARQAALSGPLAAAVHAALRGVEAMPRRAAVVLDALARLYFDSAAPHTEARPGLLPRLSAARDAHTSTPPARAMPSTPEAATANAAAEAATESLLWDGLDLLALAEAAAALHAHPTALLFLELHRSRAPQQPPRPPVPSRPSPPVHAAEEARQRALLSWIQGGGAEGGAEGGASSPAPWRRPEVQLALLDAPDTRDVGRAHRSLQRLGAHVLLRASLCAEGDVGATRPAERARRVEAAHEAAWRLGQWGGSSSAADTLGGGGSSRGGSGGGGSGGGGSAGGGSGGGGGEDAGSGCHSAILGALQCVGSREGGAIDSAMRAVGGAQAKMVTALRGTHREAGGVARPLLIQLQLLATVRDSLVIFQGGTLADAYEAAAGGTVPRDAREQLLAWLPRRWSDQLAALEPRQEASHTEPLAALHAALLRRLHAPPADVSRVYVEAARVLRRGGDRTTARNLLCRAAEHLRGGRTDTAAGADAEGPCGWARRWQLAKLLYSQGGAMAAEAIRVASRLRRELGEAPLHAEEGRGLRLRLLRTLGCWLEEQKADGRAAIEEVLQRASLLTDAESGAEDGKPTYALARFYEIQYTQLARDTASSSYRQLRSRAKATRTELASTAAALAVAEAAFPKGKQTRKLKSHLQTLERKVILDECPLEGSAAVERYLSSAVESYWLVLTHAPHAAPRRRAHAAAALVRLWLNNAHDDSLSKEVLPPLLPPARPPAQPPPAHHLPANPLRTASAALLSTPQPVPNRSLPAPASLLCARQVSRNVSAGAPLLDFLPFLPQVRSSDAPTAAHAHLLPGAFGRTPPPLAAPHRLSPHLAPPHATSPHLAPPRPTSPPLTPPHSTSPHLNPRRSHRVWGERPLRTTRLRWMRRWRRSSLDCAASTRQRCCCSCLRCTAQHHATGGGSASWARASRS